jgi:hypothetical protein
MKRVIGILIKLVLIPLFLVGGVPIYLGVISNKIIWGIAGAILALSGFYVAFAFGMIGGAEYALRKPPKPGETWIDLNFLGMIIWQSEKITFKPPFKYSLTKSRHRRIWLKVKDDHGKGMSPSQIILKLKLDLHEDTLRKIIKEAEAGELD